MSLSSNRVASQTGGSDAPGGPFDDADSPALPEKVVREEWIGLVALLHEIQRVDPRRVLQATPRAVDFELRHPLLDRVTPLVMLLQSLESAFEIAEPEIASICFVARTEVRVAAREAEKPFREPRELLVACDVLRTRMLNAIEAVIASRKKLPTDTLELADGRAAARARTLYARLKDLLAETSRSASADTTRALGRIAVALHTMTTHDDYRDVRLSDRFVLESLYRRILEWGGPGTNDADGGQILLDAVAMSTLLEAVNKRPSLMRHDRAVIGELLAALAADAPDEALVRLLERLSGRRAELDALFQRIESRGSHPVLRRVLGQRLLELEVDLRPPAAETEPGW